MSQNTWKTNHIAILKAIYNYGPIINSSHKSLLFAIAACGNPEGKNVFVSAKTLAGKEGHSVRWTQQLLRDLEKEGFIVAVDKKGGRGRYAQYELCLTKLGIAILPTNAPQNELAPPEMPQNGNAPLTALQTLPPNAPLPEWVASDQDRRVILERRLELRLTNMERHPMNKLYRDLYEDTLAELRALESEK